MRTVSVYLGRGACRRAVLIAFDRPHTPTELTEKTKVKEDYLTRLLREFRGLGLVECLNNSELSGRIYRLTLKGRRLRNSLCAKLENYNPYKEPGKDFDWMAYAKVMRGKQRKAIFLVMDSAWRTREGIRRKALEINNKIWRPNSYEVINDLLKANLIETTWERNKAYYRLTKRGAKLKELITGSLTS